MPDTPREWERTKLPNVPYITLLAIFTITLTRGESKQRKHHDQFLDMGHVYWIPTCYHEVQFTSIWGLGSWALFTFPNQCHYPRLDSGGHFKADKLNKNRQTAVMKETGKIK